MTENPSWVDLASERVGGRATHANDEFFAEKENLLKAGRGVFIEDKYTDRGKWMDGWESRRRTTTHRKRPHAVSRAGGGDGRAS